MKKVFAFVIALGLINLTSYSQEVAGAGSDSTAKTETVAQADSAKTTDVVAEESASAQEQGRAQQLVSVHKAAGGGAVQDLGAAGRGSTVLIEQQGTVLG